MANTYLNNLDFVPETFRDYVEGELLKKSNFLASEAVIADDVVFPQYGNTVTLPFWDQLGGDAQLKSDVAPSVANLTTSVYVAPIMERVKLYGSNDLVSSFTGSDPWMGIANRVSNFWAGQLDKALVASALGSAAGIGASVVNDISAASGSAAVLSAGAIIDTQALGGEFFTDFTLLVVHSQVMALLRKLNLTVQIPNSDGTRVFEYYGDARIVVSDTVGMNPSTGVYNTLVVRPGAFLYSDGTKPEQVLEFDREIGFADKIATSKRAVIAPRGAKFIGTPAGATASDAELLASANWSLGAPDAAGYGVRVLRHKIQ